MRKRWSKKEKGSPPTVVAVLFNDRAKVHYYNPGFLRVRRGTEVIAESNRGIEVGKALTDPMEMPSEAREPPPRNILRIMTEADRRRHAENLARNEDAFTLGRKLIAEHALAMQLIEVERTFDGNRIFFYFVADERIDFRDLVKDLAAALKRRILMQQVGVRDAAKRMGGCGACGRELCCGTWLRAFDPISIRMAKDQGLPLNPTKLSGVCGRLKCCLRYESVFYKEMLTYFPKMGARFETPKGIGKVVERNVIKGEVTIDVPEQGRCNCPCGPGGCNACE